MAANDRVLQLWGIEKRLPGTEAQLKIDDEDDNKKPN